MRNYKLKGFILRTKNLNDTDRLYTFYSKEKGKITLKARGVKRIKSKLSPLLDKFNRLDLEIAKGRGDIDVITAAHSLENFKALKNDLFKIAFSNLILEIIDKTSPFEEKNVKVYSLLQEALENIDKIEDLKQIEIVYGYFIANILEILGSRPCIESCLVCGKSIAEIDKAIFDCNEGGVFCTACSKNKSSDEKVNLEEMKIINAFYKLELSKILTIEINEPSFIKALDLLKRFHLTLSGEPYNSEAFLKKVKI